MMTNRLAALPRTICLLLGAVAVLAACAKSNELPETYRGAFPMTRLLGSDNVTITVANNSLSMAGCDVNCPDPVLPFTTISCPSHDECNVAGPDCTGTIELWNTSGRALEIHLEAVPGATGPAAEKRQVNCFQYSGTTEAAP